jgi:hypothetical protein
MHKKGRFQSAIALLIGAALLVPVGSIAAQKVNMTRLVDQIAKAQLRPPKFQRPLPPRSGTLEPGGEIDQSFGLTKGQGYAFVAVGDDNAKDVDLQLVDRNGEVVAEDNDEDKSAVVTFSPPQKARYYARVIMFDCEAEECEYGIGVYKGKKNLQRR